MARKNLFIDAEEPREESDIQLTATGGKVTQADEDKEILQEIEEQVNRGRTEYSRDMLRTREGRSGVLMPIAVITATLLLFGSTILAVQYFSGKTMTVTVTREVDEAGAINQLIKQLREKAESEIAGKQEEIDSLLNDLTSATESLQKQRLAINIKVEQRKSLQEQEIEQKVNQEKERLVAQEVADAEMQRRLAEYEAIIREEYNQKLLAYREQLQQDIEKKEAQLANLESDYKSKLELTNREIEKIRAESARKQREYDRKLIDLNAQIMKDIESVTADLADLQTLKDREEMLQRQLNGFYMSVNNQIQAGEMDEAQRTLRLMREFMKSPSYLSSTTLTESAESDLLINELLQEYIAIKQTEEKRAEVARRYSFKKDPEFITMESNFNRGIEQTITAIDKQDIEKALENFNSALGHLPSGVSASSALQTIINENSKQLRSELTVELARQFENANTLQKEALRKEFLNRITELEEESLNLKADASRLREELVLQKSDSSQHEIRIEELLTKIGELESRPAAGESPSAVEVRRIRRELEDSNREQESLRSQLTEAADQISTLEARLKAGITDSPATDPGSRLQVLESELTQERSISSRLQQEILTAQERLDEIERINSELSETNGALVAERSAIVSERDSLIEELRLRNDEMAQKEETITTLREQIASIENAGPAEASQELLSQITRYEEERTGYLDEITRLSSLLEEAQTEVDEYKSAGRVKRSAERQITQLSREKEELEKSLEESLKSASEKAEALKRVESLHQELVATNSKMETELIEAAARTAEYETIREEYRALIRHYNSLDKNNPYSLLTMENRFGNFFSSKGMNEFLPDFDEIFEDYTKTIRDQSSGQDKIYAGVTNNLKEIASYPDRESMLETIDELIDFEQDNRFKVTLLLELKALVEGMKLAEQG